jgi:hypothetical protein
MLVKKNNLLFCILLILTISAFCQDKSNVKFGKIAPPDFEVQSSLIDSSTNAVVIADIGSSAFEGNTKGWFSLVFKRIKRIKILNEKGFDAANFSIPLYSSNGNA